MIDRSALNQIPAIYRITIFTVAVSLVGMIVGAPALPAQSRAEERLIRKLVSRNNAVRSRTLAELESDLDKARASIPQLAAAAEQISAKTKPNELAQPSTIRLIQLIGKFDTDVSEQALVELLDSPHRGIAMVAADTLGKNKFHGSIDFLKRQTSRPDYKTSYAFRFNLIRALIEMEHPDAIEFVGEQSRILDGQLRHKTDKALSTVTAEYFGSDTKRFKQWVQSRQKPKSLFKATASEPESLNRIRFGKQQYYGIDIHAKRLMFIIDHSGSMREYSGGQTRLARAKFELTKAIEALPPDTEFALLFYDSDIHLWRDELVVANEENKRQAIYFVGRLEYGSKTNTYGSLRRALEFDDRLEAVFLLTDGQPTTGAIIRPMAIVDDILHRNRFRHLNFNTIGIAVGGQTELFLKTLAEESAGEFRMAN